MSENLPPRRTREVPWVPIGAIAGVVAALAAVLAILPTGGSSESDAAAGGASVPSATVGPATTVGSPRSPQGGSEPTVGSMCVRSDGRPIDCGNVEAMIATSASPCDAIGAVRALGGDPQVVEILVETASYSGGCAIRPNKDARAAGATLSDLFKLADGELRAPLAACWPDRPTSPMVPCATVHHFEPVTAWAPLDDPTTLTEKCRSAASRFVAGPVDVPDGRLTSMPLVTQEASPRYRCVVASSVPLKGSVYRLSGRELPVA